MGIDLAISNMAFAEARSTGEAQLLVAKHRADLEAAMSEFRTTDAPADGAPVNHAGDLYRAMLQIQSRVVRAPVDGTGVQFDKTA